MSFFISTHNLPTVRNYDTAVEVATDEDRRDFGHGWRGLNGRRDSSKLVQLRTDDSVAFKYHHTELVVWHPDRVVVTLYESVSSGMFINCFIPRGTWLYRKDTYSYIHDRTGGYHGLDGTVTLRRNNYDEWVVDTSNVSRFEAKVLDRKAANRIRKICQPFRDWEESVRRVGGSSVLHKHKHEQYHILSNVKDMLQAGRIPEEAYPMLTQYNPSDVTMYILGGAVKTVELPLGAARKPTKYDNSPAWNYV